MRDEVVDFCSAVHEKIEATVNPRPDCMYGYAKAPSAMLVAFEHHNREICQRAQKITREEQSEAIAFAIRLKPMSPQLDRVVVSINRMIEPK